MTLLAQPLDEMNRDALAVDVAVEIEDQHLEEHGPSADRRPRADARDAVEELRAEPADAHGEDAVDRRAAALQVHVRGRESERLPEAAPADDAPGQAEIPAKHLPRLSEIAGRERRANRRAADPLAAQRYRRHDGDLEAVLVAAAAQIVETAAAPEPEAEIVTDDDLARPEPRDEQILDERLWRKAAELAKARAENLVDAGLLEQLEALPKAREPRRRIVRRQHLSGHRLERDDVRRNPARAGGIERGRENPLMAEMQAVERADRDGPPVGGRGDRADVAVKAHASTSGRTRRRRVLGVGLGTQRARPDPDGEARARIDQHRARDQQAEPCDLRLRAHREPVAERARRDRHEHGHRRTRG